MTLSETSVQGVDLENSESQMRDAIAKTIDDRVDELAQLVDRSLGGSPGGCEPAPSVAPQPRVSAISFDEDEPHAEIESAQGSDESDDKIFYGFRTRRMPRSRHER